MSYTVKQLSNYAGISVRTLHYYDQIELLEPSSIGENGYRYYEDAAVFRLQQILLFREMGLSLNEIKEIMDTPGFDLMAALEMHKDRLQAKIRRLSDLIDTVDNTILHLMGGVAVSEKKFFKGFTKEEEKHYQEEARQRWGSEEVDASYKRWDSYSAQKQEDIKAEGGKIYTDLAEAMDEGATSETVQQIIGRWHQHMRYFYEPSLERLMGLGQMYIDDTRFAEKFRAIHPDLPEFMQEAINHYCLELQKNS